MSPEETKRAYRKELLLALALIAAGLLITGLSLIRLESADTRMAQATQPLQSSPPAQNNAPAEAKPGGERPTTPAPEPARPDVEAQKTGVTPALPPAPAEKTGEPIKEK